MKPFVISLLVLSVVNLSFAGDDGQYHPETNGDYGIYNRPYPYDFRNAYSANPNFNRGLTRFSNKYDSTYIPYRGPSQPVQELLAPLAGSESKQRVEEFPTTPVPVTVPSVPLTYRPAVYTSTPTPNSQWTASPTRVQYSGPSRNTGIFKNEYDLDANAKTYHYAYQSDNGIAAEESGRADSGNGEGIVVVGFYEFKGADGVTYRVDYTADKYGFHPRGAHLPA